MNIIQPFNSSEERYPRWVKASHRLARYEPFMVPTVQGLGQIDDRLSIIDAKYVAGEGYCSEEFGVFDLTEHITMSYLWVLGAYEILRVIDQRERRANSPGWASISKVHREFARLRMPLAKFVKADRHKSDSHVAYPALNSQYGVAWQVAENTFISRGELSDHFLVLLEGAAFEVREN